MKTSTSKVLCDYCREPIPVFEADAQTNLDAVYVTLKGPNIGYKKLDFCSPRCLHYWTGLM